MQRAVPILVLGALLVLVVVLCFAANRLIALDARLSEVLLRRELTMQTLTQTVTRANGSTVTVSTVRLEGESLDAWIARHDAAVAALKA